MIAATTSGSSTVPPAATRRTASTNSRDVGDPVLEQVADRALRRWPAARGRRAARRTATAPAPGSPAVPSRAAIAARSPSSVNVGGSRTSTTAASAVGLAQRPVERRARCRRPRRPRSRAPRAAGSGRPGGGRGLRRGQGARHLQGDDGRARRRGLDTLIVPSNAASRRITPRRPVPASRVGAAAAVVADRRRAARPSAWRELDPGAARRRRACRRWPGTRRPRSTPPTRPAPAAGRRGRRGHRDRDRHVERQRLHRAGQAAVGEHRRVDAADHRRAGRRAPRRWCRGPRASSLRAASGSSVEQSRRPCRGSCRARPAGPGRRRAGRARSGAARRPSGRRVSARDTVRSATRCSSVSVCPGLRKNRSIAARARMIVRRAVPPDPGGHDEDQQQHGEQRRATKPSGDRGQRPGQVAPGHRVARPRSGGGASSAGPRSAAARTVRRAPGCVAAIERWRSASHRSAGTLTSRIGMPTAMIASAAPSTTKTNTTIVGTEQQPAEPARTPVQPPRRRPFRVHGSILPDRGRRDSGPRSTPVRVLAPLTGGRGSAEGSVHHRFPGSRDPNRGDRHDATPSAPSRCAPPAGAPPTRGARSLGWLAFVALAVGLAIAVPTHETDRRRLPAGRVRPRRRDGRRGRPRRARHRERPDHRPGRRAAGRHRGRGRRGRSWSPACAAVEGVDEVAEPQWSPDRSALLVSVAARPRPGRRRRRCRTSPRRWPAEHPGPGGPRGRRRLPRRRRSTSGSPRTSRPPRASACRSRWC